MDSNSINFSNNSAVAHPFTVVSLVSNFLYLLRVLRVFLVTRRKSHIFRRSESYILLICKSKTSRKAPWWILLTQKEFHHGGTEATENFTDNSRAAKPVIVLFSLASFSLPSPFCFRSGGSFFSLCSSPCSPCLRGASCSPKGISPHRHGGQGEF